ncbi:MAG TPA: ribonuclease domain-containing protein [Longimicrobiales bacterium]
MNPRHLFALIAGIVLAVFGSRWLSPPAPAPELPSQAATAEQVAPAALIVRDIAVRDRDGRIAWRGDVDLAPVLARIESGERDEHRNDGGIFRNRERLLPERPDGYYREYVVRTPGIAHAGPQRLVLGDSGEIFYTADHYASFKRIR